MAQLGNYILFGCILSLVQIILLVISTITVDRENMATEIPGVLLKFAMLNIIFVAVLDRF